MPGRLQTRSYAHALLKKFSADLTADEIQARLDARMRRRDDLIQQDPPPYMRILLDQSSLDRIIGGPEVAGRQLLDLAETVTSKGFHIRIMPYAVDAPLPSTGFYELLYLGPPENEGEGLLYREHHTTDDILEDQAKVRQHRRIFDQLWDVSINEGESIALLRQRAQVLLSK